MPSRVGSVPAREAIDGVTDGQRRAWDRENFTLPPPFRRLHMRYCWSVLVGGLLLSACVSANDAVPRAQVFVSPRGQISIDLPGGVATVLGRTIPLTNCSDADYYCFESAAGGPNLTLPKRCDGYKPVVMRGDHKVEWLTILHPGWYIMKDSRSPDYAFVVSEGFGIQEILFDHDGSGEIRSATGKTGISFDNLEQYRYLRAESSDFFWNCRSGK
jgi:hypothetical protein